MISVVGMDPGFGGGAWAQTKAFLDGARELGHEVSFHFAEHPSLTRDEPGTSVPFGRVDALNRLIARFDLDGSVWVVSPTAPYGYAALKSGKPYACWLGAGVAEEAAARSIGLRASRRAALAVNRPVLRRLERAVIRGASKLYATSPSSRAEIARGGGVDEDAIGILPIPVDLDAFRPGEPAGVVVFVGRADDPRKNAKLLLDAWPLIRARRPDVRLRLVGVPPTYVPDGVEATGTVPSVAEQLRDASLFVLPSWHEGFGIVAAEALAAGVPVLATPSGGPESLVRESGGGRVLQGFTPEELAETAVEMLGDAASLSAMRQSGRQYIERTHSPARFREFLAQALG